MKKLLPAIIFLSMLVAHSQGFAQCPLTVYDNLDSGTTVKEQYNWFGYTTDFLNYPNLIKIDRVNYPNNRWQVGRPQKTVFDSAYSFANVIVTDTVHSCTPSDTSVFTVHMPILGMGLCHFSFHYKLDIDTGDLALLEFSADTGAHWTNVLFDSTHLFYFPNGKPDWTRSTTRWDSLTVEGGMHGYSDSFLLRFTFISDSDTSARDGWMIDNFSFGFALEDVPIVNNKPLLQISPNPVATALTIAASETINTLEVRDLLGTTLLHQRCNANEVNIDVSSLSAGVYLLRINDTEVRRFVKE